MAVSKRAKTAGALVLLAASATFVANQVLSSYDRFIEESLPSFMAENSGNRILFSPDNIARRRGKEAKLRIRDRHLSIDQSLTSFNFDPKPIEHLSHDIAEGVQPDGTYLLVNDSFDNGPNDSCMPLVEAEDRIERVHFHFASCKKFDKMFGNRLAKMYGMKMIAYAMRKPFTFTCGLAEGESPMGAAYFMKLNALSDAPGPIPNRNGKEYSAREICQRFCAGRYCSWSFQNLDLASDAMISDWNYLASSEVVPSHVHDDAVIHLRLGDGLYTYGFNLGKGIFPHATYINLLKQAREEKGDLFSIGIVTAPFKGSNVRAHDRGSASLSEQIVQELIKALQAEFPEAEVRLHNSPDSTIVESLSRLVHARKVAICGCSTFCPYALLATEGIGFIHNGSGNGAWVPNAAEWHENIRLFDTPMLNGQVIHNKKNGYVMPQERVLRWLREQDPHVGNVDIFEAPIFRFQEK